MFEFFSKLFSRAVSLLSCCYSYKAEGSTATEDEEEFALWNLQQTVLTVEGPHLTHSQTSVALPQEDSREAEHRMRGQHSQ